MHPLHRQKSNAKKTTNWKLKAAFVACLACAWECSISPKRVSFDGSVMLLCIGVHNAWNLWINPSLVRWLPFRFCLTLQLCWSRKKMNKLSTDLPQLLHQLIYYAWGEWLSMWQARWRVNVDEFSICCVICALLSTLNALLSNLSSWLAWGMIILYLYILCFHSCGSVKRWWKKRGDIWRSNAKLINKMKRNNTYLPFQIELPDSRCLCKWSFKVPQLFQVFPKLCSENCLTNPYWYSTDEFLCGSTNMSRGWRSGGPVPLHFTLPLK